MDITETIQSSFTAISANKLRSALTILGIVIGVTSVILLVALVSGLQSYITNQIEGLGSNLLFVIPGKIGGARSPGGVQVNKLKLSHVNDLNSKLSQEADVCGVVQKTGTLKYTNKKDEGASVFGVQANYTKIISLEIEKGRFFTNSEANSGRRVAVIGTSAIRVLFDGGQPLGKTIDVSGIKYTVIGITEPRGSIFGIDQDNSVLIPLTSAQKQFGTDQLNTIYISANSPDKVKSVQEKAKAIIAKSLSEDEFSIMSQEQTLSTINQITSTLSVALGGIAAISLLVGGIGVMNIMLVSVTERTREIGLRKALGAKPSDIRNQFLIEAVTLSALGGIVGIALGVLFSTLINHFIQTSITPWSIIISFAFSMAVGVIFGVAPAIRASRLNPIEALRYE